jgi:hypothetical protein
MARRWSIGSALLATALLASACSGADEPSGRGTTPTPITRLDTAAVRLARAAFCDRVPKAAVRRALGAPSSDPRSWGNGDPVDTDAGSGEVGHEIGCAWTGTGGAAARAWVYARPVTAAFAATVVRAAGRQRGCTSQRASVFGSPALVQHCTLPGGLARERRAGLFGDTWLTCELTLPGPTPAAEHRSRLDAWCATTVAALRTR